MALVLDRSPVAMQGHCHSTQTLQSDGLIERTAEMMPLAQLGDSTFFGSYNTDLYICRDLILEESTFHESVRSYSRQLGGAA